MMRLRRKLFYGLVAVAACLLLAVFALFVQADRAPRQYRPRELSSAQRDEAMREFARKCQELYNDVQRRRRFEWSISQRQLNEYLASIDEIASGLPGDILPGTVLAAMREADLADPAAALEPDGRIILMVRLIRWDKVLSVSLKIDFPEAGVMKTRFLGARIGRLPLPESLARDALQRIKSAVRDHFSVGRLPPARNDRYARPVGPSSDDMARLLAAVLLAVDEQPISTSLELDRKTIRVTDIRVTDKSMTLLVEPERMPPPLRTREQDEGWPAEFNLGRRR